MTRSQTRWLLKAALEMLHDDGVDADLTWARDVYASVATKLRKTDPSKLDSQLADLHERLGYEVVRLEEVRARARRVGGDL